MFTRRSRISLALVALVLLAAPVRQARAQSPGDSVMPRAGSWGAEGSVGGYSGGSVLRMAAPQSAWLFGGSFGMSSTRSNFGGAEDLEQDFGAIQLRLGHRWWRGASQGRVQPLFGAGVTAGGFRANGAREVSGGLYAEAGTTYFVLPRVGLSGVGELNVGYSDYRQAAFMGRPETVIREWSAQVALARLALAVFF